MEGYAPFGDLKTWYEVHGDLGFDQVPMLIVHGGPGYTHDYLESFAALADAGRAVILYDQIGNGKSSPGPAADADFWVLDRLVDELASLVRHLGLSRHVVLGHSVGAGIAASYALRRPHDLEGLILANGYARSREFFEGLWTLRRGLPEPVQATLATHEATGEFGHPDYQAALGAFFTRHICRLAEMPEPLLRSVMAAGTNPNVFATMYGPSLFRLNGTLANWSIADRLSEIEVPTLVYRGAFDEVTANCTETLLRGLPAAQSARFAQSSHVPHLEEAEVCLETVGAFLAGIDQQRH
jgi:L-proline amide hydrolase